jgi:hypothetical protein
MFVVTLAGVLAGILAVGLTGLFLETVTVVLSDALSEFLAIALGGTGGAINSGCGTDGDGLIACEITGEVNGVSEVNSILDTGVISGLEFSPSGIEGRLGGLTNEDARGMGERWLVTTAVLVGDSELGSSIGLIGLDGGLIGGSRGGVDPTLTETGGEVSRMVGLVTARICCLAVRASASLVFAAAATFFSEALESAGLE